MPCAWLAWLSGSFCRLLSRGRTSLRAAAFRCSRLLAAARCCANRSVPRRRTSLRAAARIARLGKINRPCLAAVRGCSQLIASPRQPGHKSLGRVYVSPLHRSALRGYSCGRDSLRAARHSALPRLMCALACIFKSATQTAPASGTGTRWPRLRQGLGALGVPRQRLGLMPLGDPDFARV
jgi:hypothetical protein